MISSEVGMLTEQESKEFFRKKFTDLFFEYFSLQQIPEDTPHKEFARMIDCKKFFKSHQLTEIMTLARLEVCASYSLRRETILALTGINRYKKVGRVTYYQKMTKKKNEVPAHDINPLSNTGDIQETFYSRLS